MKAKKVKSATIRVYNCSKQMVALQVRTPGADFFASEQQIRLNPGKDVMLPKSCVNQDQIQNLQRRRIISINYDDTEE